jgi:GH25 family lysozyme M1 (1,4-beta-N-acetylmuramidase)
MPAGYVNMIDVSKWCGDIEWARVFADPFAPKVVLCRATLGHTYRDDKYVEYMRGLRPHNVLRGAYHVITPNIGADDHLRHIEDTLRDAPPVDFNVVDVELDKGQSPERIAGVTHDVAAGIEKLGWKHKVMIYTAAWFWDPKVGGIPLSDGQYKPNAEDWALHVAHYKPIGSGGGPRLPIGWDEYFVWQHSKTGQIEGIPSSVDLNIMKESYFNQLGGVTAPDPTPEPIPDPEPTPGEPWGVIYKK